MKHTRPGLPAWTLALLGFACAVPQDDPRQVPTWEQFRSQAFQEPETGIFIVDGDTPVLNEKHLREFYELLLRDDPLPQTPGVARQPLIVNRVGGADDRWSDTQKLAITYCVSTGFGTRYSTVVQAMSDAATAWEAVANVDFVHASAQDGSCTSSNSTVVFDVNPVNVNGQYLARAFFPSSPRSARNVLIDNSAFTTAPPLTLTGILRHELGHTIGFRHEHTRPEAAACFEDNNWRALTPYDSASVMHYPQCNGTGDWSLVLTAYDGQGAASLYGAPGTPPPPPPPPPSGTPVTETFSASVAAGQEIPYGPFDVVAGSTFEAVTTGTGDADLYVNWGSPATRTTYVCRPYTVSSNETCRLQVPAGVTRAYVMVRGYTAASYGLTVSYLRPDGAPPPATDVTETFHDSVAWLGQNHYGPFSVVPGSTFKAVMTGSGDPDLYVRFGARPTTTAFDCRPYLWGANESCTLTVPAGQSTAYVMVRGYSSGTYDLTVTYRRP